MKKSIVFIFIFTFTIKCYSFSIIERLKMPSNVNYIKKFNLNLNLIKKENKKNEENKAEVIEKRIDYLELLKLTGIFKIGKNFYAIINGNAFPVGAKIDNLKILSININKVVLKNKINNEKVVLKIEN